MAHVYRQLRQRRDQAGGLQSALEAGRRGSDRLAVTYKTVAEALHSTALPGAKTSAGDACRRSRQEEEGGARRPDWRKLQRKL